MDLKKNNNIIIIIIIIRNIKNKCLLVWVFQFNSVFHRTWSSDVIARKYRSGQWFIFTVTTTTTTTATDIPYCYGEINGGLLGFSSTNKSKTTLESWSHLYYKYVTQTSGWDQPSLRMALWSNNASIYILPPEYNVRSIQLLEKIKRSKEILFFIHKYVSPSLLSHGSLFFFGPVLD